MFLLNSDGTYAEDIYKAVKKGHMLGVSFTELRRWFYFFIQQLFVAVDDQNIDSPFTIY